MAVYNDNHNKQIEIIKLSQYIVSSKKATMSQSLQLPKTNILYSQINWISTTPNYKQYSIQQIQQQNTKILQTLKTIQSKLTKHLQKQSVPTANNNTNNSTPNIKNNSNSKVNSNESDQYKTLCQQHKNNQKYIAVLKHDSQSAYSRKQKINQGLQSKTIQIRFALQRNIVKLKNQIKLLKLQEHSTQKILVNIGDQPENIKDDQRMEEQLRVYSIKYVRLLDKYNKSTEKLALASKVQLPDYDFPEDIYDKQLQQRQQAQYKQYQGIVKLCQVLSHRNDSEHNKAHRQYTGKLKQLQRIIFKLGQLDQAITVRQGEYIESKKNIELIKVRLQNGQSYDTRAMILSQSSIPRGKSYSNIKLPPQNTRNKLRSRGYSMAKLKIAQ